MVTEKTEKKEKAQIDNLLQICSKAGQLAFGKDAAERLLHKRKALLVICSHDLSESTYRSVRKSCEGYNMIIYRYGSKKKLGNMFGRKETGILTVKDRNFASGIRKVFDTEKL